MGNEKKLVVNPLKRYFLNPGRSGARWHIKDEPRFETAATGWDLQVERKNQVLLIEAKYIQGPFVAALAGLVIAPLTNKKEKMKSGKKQSWSSVVCWAVGCSYEKGEKDKKYKMGGIYQRILDYFARNLAFWAAYSRTLKVKYIFLVDKKKVAKIRFDQIIELAVSYKPALDKSLNEKRKKAEELLKNLSFR